LFSYGHQNISGSDPGVPSRLGLDTYQFGLYGAYALRPGTEIDFLLDGGINQNRVNRSLSFVGSTAIADYLSYSGHAGVAIEQLIPLREGFSILPSLRLDYAQVRADAYRESGAGGLNLNVDSQAYRELMLSAGVKASYRIADRTWLTADGGVGYNLLNDRLQTSAAFVSSGDSFVTTAFSQSPWLYSAGLGLSSQRTDNLELGARYGVQANPSGFLNQTGSFTLRVKLCWLKRYRACAFRDDDLASRCSRNASAARQTTSEICSSWPASGLVLRQTMPMVRDGCGLLKRATETVAERVSTATAISGIRVTPMPAPTICTSVDSELASSTSRGGDCMLQNDSAWSRKQCPSSSSKRRISRSVS
jgi:hypothetical protein